MSQKRVAVADAHRHNDSHEKGRFFQQAALRSSLEAANKKRGESSAQVGLPRFNLDMTKIPVQQSVQPIAAQDSTLEEETPSLQAVQRMEEKPIEAIEGEAVEKLEAAGGTLTGKLQWQGFLPTDLAELATVLLQICQGTAESNDFLKLVFKDVDPGEAAIMSCWEFVFYVAYRAGAIDREYLQTLFKLASQKAKTVYNKILTTTATPLAIRYGGFGSIPILQMKTHQKNALNYAFQGFCQVIEPELGVSTQQKWTEGEIPSGCVVFFNRWLDHTALSLGMKDGQQKILTLWPHPTVVEMNLDDLVTHIVSLRRPKPTIYFTNPPWL